MITAKNLEIQLREDMKKLWDSKQYKVATSKKFLDTFSTSLSNYIKDNAELTFNWLAFNIDGEPDPQTIVTGKFKSLQFRITRSFSNTQLLLPLQIELIQGMVTSTWNITQSGWNASPAIGATSPFATTLFVNLNSGDSLYTLCQQIIQWIKSQRLTIHAGSHASYSGIGILTGVN